MRGGGAVPPTARRPSASLSLPTRLSWLSKVEKHLCAPVATPVRHSEGVTLPGLLRAQREGDHPRCRVLPRVARGLGQQRGGEVPPAELGALCASTEASITGSSPLVSAANSSTS